LSGWLLDTNVISELRKPRPEKKVRAFLSAHPLGALFVSDVTVAEIRFGIELTSDPTKRAVLTDWLAHQVRPMFEGRTLPVSEDVLVKWRLLVHEGRKHRHTFSQPDLFLAATALHHGLIIVTRDAAEFERAGAKVHNPWK
jgi:predicted nucleic acid-binding protein